MKAEQRGQRLCVQQNPQPAPFSPGTMWWPEHDLHDPPTALRGGANSTGETAEVHRRHWTSSRLRHVTINTQPHNVGLCARPAQWLTPPEQWGSRWPHSHPVPPQAPGLAGGRSGPCAAPSGRGAACRPGPVSSGPRPVGPRLLLKQIPRRLPSSPTGKWGA